MSKEGYGNPSEKYFADATPFKKAILSEDFARAAELVDEDSAREELNDMIVSDGMAYRALQAANELGHEDLAEMAARVILNENNGYSEEQRSGAEGYLKKVEKFEAAEITPGQVSEMLLDAYNEGNFSQIRELVSDEKIVEALDKMMQEDQVYAVFTISKELDIPDLTFRAAKTMLGRTEGNFHPDAKEQAKSFLEQFN